MSTLDPERIILGCGNFGGVGSLPRLCGLGEDETQARILLDTSRELGIFRFDTANTYGGGRSEEILGQWISEQDKTFRQKIQVSTKVGNPFGKFSGQGPLSAIEISFHLQESLKKLNVSQVETYYLHEPDPLTPLDETLEALEQALENGDISSIGLSNVELPYVQNFLQAGGERTCNKVLFVQNEFHFLQQRDKVDLLPFLQKQGISYVAFGALAGGLLTGKYQTQDSQPLPGSRLDLRPEPYSAYLNLETFLNIDHFLRDAAQRKMNPITAALRFVLETEGVDSVIIGPRRKEHFENMGLK